MDKLPKNSTWNDLMNEIYVRQVVESGLADSKAKYVDGLTETIKKIMAIDTSLEMTITNGRIS